MERYTIGTTEYVRHVSGLYFPADTAPRVADVIAQCAASRARVRVFYGDTSTGRAWAEENDVTGTIGRSTGPCRVPLLVNNARSYGGGSLLSARVVAVRCTTSRAWLYRHPGFNPGTWAVTPADVPGYVECVTHDGELHARFTRPGAGARYCAFMTGERFAK